MQNQAVFSSILNRFQNEYYRKWIFNSKYVFLFYILHIYSQANTKVATSFVKSVSEINSKSWPYWYCKFFQVCSRNFIYFKVLIEIQFKNLSVSMVVFNFNRCHICDQEQLWETKDLKTYGSTSSNNPAVKVIITIVVMNENKNDCEVTTVPRRMSHQRLKLDYVNVVMCNNNIEVRRMFSIGTFIFYNHSWS